MTARRLRASAPLPPPRSRRGLKFSLAAMLLLSTLTLRLSTVHAQPFALESWSIDGGGGTSAGSGFSLTGTIGQPDAGVLAGGGFTLVGGFPGWHIVPAGPVTLTVQLRADGRVHVTWARGEAAWQLEVATRFGATADWQTVSAPGATSYTAPTTGPTRFFRLSHP